MKNNGARYKFEECFLHSLWLKVKQSYFTVYSYDRFIGIIVDVLFVEEYFMQGKEKLIYSKRFPLYSFIPYDFISYEPQIFNKHFYCERLKVFGVRNIVKVD